MSPDLVTFFSAPTTWSSRRFDIDAVAEEIETVHRQVGESGATLLTFTLPDLTPVMPAARRIAPRVTALCEAIREISKRSGAVLVDFAEHPVASDPRLWSEDRLHANAAGHARIAAALAHALGLPDAGAGMGGAAAAAAAAVGCSSGPAPSCAGAANTCCPGCGGIPAGPLLGRRRHRQASRAGPVAASRPP